MKTAAAIAQKWGSPARYCRQIIWLFALGGLWLLPCWALAQPMPTDPAAQNLLRQQRERALRRQHERTPDVRLPRLPAISERFPARESPCFPIRRITLTGDDASLFQFALASVTAGDDPAVGRCLGTRGINAVMARVQNAIVARGYVTTRVLAAPQDLKQGVLALTVIPGRVRAIRFAPGSSPRGTAWNALPLSPGDLLNLHDIEQGLENFKRVPTADADIRIEPARGAGVRPGQSDLVIRYRQSFPFRLTLSVDDGGSKATGKYQGGVTLSYDNWWTLNDLFYVSFNHDLGGGEDGPRGTRGYTVHYSLPFGYWLAGITGSSYRYYQAVAGANQTYVYSGTGRNAEVKLSRVIHRNGTGKTSASLRGYLQTSDNFIDDTEVEVQRRRMAGWEAALSQREFIGAATLDLNLAYRRGTGAFDALPAPEQAFGEGTARPKVITANATLALPFTLGKLRLRYNSTWRAQWARTPLVPQDRFAIGGRYTVRGFDGENLLSGDNGWLLRNDLGVALGASGQQFYLGLDYGEVGGPSSKLLVGTRLTGAVLGLRGGYKGFAYDLFDGWPLRKPEGFKTATNVAGFNLSWSFEGETMRFNTAKTLDITAPALIKQNWSEAEALGAAVWLWMHSESHRQMPLHTLSTLLLPAIKHRQFILAAEAGRAVFYLSWANLSPEGEQRYSQRHPLCMPEADWNSGERMWILDWVAPFGHSWVMQRLLARQLFANRQARFLDHRGEQRGLKIKTFRGMAVLPEEARAWFATHPVAPTPTVHSTSSEKESI